MNFDNIINSILKEELSREDRIKALKTLKTGDVRCILFNMYSTEEGYLEPTTHIISLELTQNSTLDDVYNIMLANYSPEFDGWGSRSKDVRFIAKKNEIGFDRRFPRHHPSHFLFAFLIPSSNTAWFPEFDKFESDVEEDGLHYIDSNNRNVLSGWNEGLKDKWDEYVMSILDDYGWLDRFRD